MKSLKELREAKMMTQTEVAASLGISHVTVSKAELGKGVPHGRTIRGLAVLFDVDPIELRDALQKQEA